MLLRLSLLSALAHTGLTSTLRPLEQRSSGISWGPCNDKKLEKEATTKIQCGTVTVPFDYAEPKNGKTLDIELVKSPAIKKPASGKTIIMNFGGPGESGRESMAQSALLLQTMTGGTYDIVGFDQRGVGKTLQFKCKTKDDAESSLFVTSLTAGNASDVAQGQLWATAGAVADICYRSEKDIGSVIGTVATARDMMQMVDRFQEDGLLRYWGISYGTAVGQTVASIFPDRMERVVLDGNLNPFEFWKWHDVEMYSGTDLVVEGIIKACVETPKLCPLARNKGATYESILADIEALFEHLKYHPFSYKGAVYDYSYLRGNMLGALYTPASYPTLVYVLDGLIKGNHSVVAYLPNGNDVTSERRWGIICSDKTTRGWPEARSAIAALAKESKWAGDVPTQVIDMCARWRFNASQRHNNNFDVRTRHPALIVNNAFDPVTPIVSARNMSTTMRGSVVLEQEDGYGHSSLAMPSKCVAKYLTQYFGDGTLPEEGTKCKSGRPVLSTTTWQERFGVKG